MDLYKHIEQVYIDLYYTLFHNTCRPVNCKWKTTAWRPVGPPSNCCHAQPAGHMDNTASCLRKASGFFLLMLNYVYSSVYPLGFHRKIKSSLIKMISFKISLPTSPALPASQIQSYRLNNIIPWGESLILLAKSLLFLQRNIAEPRVHVILYSHWRL